MRTMPDPRLLPPDLARGFAAPDDAGAVTAEYAIATIAAVGFAALLVVLLRSDLVRGLLTDLIRHALAVPA